MAKEITRDGKTGVFKDDATEEEINAYFESLKEPVEPEETKDKEEGKRGILADVPVQSIGGALGIGAQGSGFLNKFFQGGSNVAKATTTTPASFMTGQYNWYT